MSDELIEIESMMLENYINNMKFLKKHDASLFSRIEELSQYIENDSLKQRYSLEVQNNQLNILDIKNNSKLYKDEPYYDANYKKSRYYPNIQESISLIKTDKIKHIRNPKYEIDSFEYLNEYIQLICDKEILKNKKFKYIGKYVFIGTLLGIHIEKLHKKIQSKNYLIVEDSLEIFRLSLFFCNYKKIAKKSNIIFMVELNKSELQMGLKTFLKNDFEYNHIIKYTLASSKYRDSLESFVQNISLENPLLYTFSDYLGAYSRGVDYILDDYKILNFIDNKEIFKDKSALYIGPGPSLSKNIKFIKESQNKFVLVCLASTLKLLSQNNITPDIIISIDASTNIIRQFDVPKKYFKNSIVVISSKTDHTLVKKLNKDNLYMVQDSLEFFRGFGILMGNSSGEMGYSLCSHFNFKDLYLLGMDVSLNQKTRSTHDKSYYENREISNSDYMFSDFGELDFDNDILKVKGNFQEYVYTTRRFLQIISNYNHVTRNKNSNMKVYNLSNGAYLESVIPLKAKKVPLDGIEEINKKSFLKSIGQVFEKSSKRNFDMTENLEMKKDKKLCCKLLKTVEEVKKEEAFYKKFLNMKEKKPVSFIIQILSFYYELINPYINLLKEEQRISQKKLNMIQLKQIRNILEFYKCKI